MATTIALYRVFLVLVALYWVFPWVYRVLIGFTVFLGCFYRVLPGFAGFQLVILVLIGFYWLLQGVCGFHWVQLGSSGPFTGFFPGFTGFS